jgi:hypothetical protein
MRAYSCIDSHGRWTEIPTQVQFSTSHDAHPPQPPTRTSNVSSDVIDIDPGEETEDDAEEDADNAPEERVTALDVLHVIRKYANQASRSDATAPEDDDSGADEESEEGAENDAEEDAENALEQALASVSTESDGEDDSDDDPDDNDDPKNKSDADRLEETTASAAPPAQSVVPLSSNRRGRNGTASAASASSKTRSRSDATACAVSPAQALRDVVRGHNPNDRSLSDRTDCAALPAQPAAPQKPKPDADGLIWHPHPGYPNQEMSEPDAQGRVRYKIHMTTAASQLPARETDAQRAAKLIYGSVIKKYGNP